MDDDEPYALIARLLEPGVVPVSLWRPDQSHVGAAAEVSTFGGVGRKP